MVGKKEEAAKGADNVFAKNERVLCNHMSLFYPAKILEVREPEKKKRGGGGDEKTPYRVHYDGWNRRHDEWVGPERLLKATKENQERAEKERAEQAASEAGGKGGGKERRKREISPSSKASVASSASKKPRNAAAASASRAVETQKEFGSRPEIPIVMPEPLKTALIDDWDLVTRQMKIPNSASGPTVDQLIQSYIDAKRAEKEMKPLEVEQLVENARGIKDHFNVMLGAQLLYKLERPAYKEWLEEVGAEKAEASARYGWVHLLRLFVRIGTLLAYTTWSPDNIKLITANLHDFLQFLLAQKEECFQLSSYHTTTPEYQKSAWL